MQYSSNLIECSLPGASILGVWGSRP